MNSASFAPLACSAYQSNACRESRGLKIAVICCAIGLPGSGVLPTSTLVSAVFAVFFFSSFHSHEYFAATSSLTDMNDVAVTIDSSDTEIRGTSEHCLSTASFCQHDGLVMRKGQALRNAR